ncbi:hypothetical protein BDB00DRAFT_756678 [Zychaea mexicana]|uniref:uncharacterized protein n=1 Tax=Zychaea mexicana TaxID=64656 RepID=UPI0022FE3F25|nr:uncharacterized protein BDB00DRAFT_756678 [Zychaea mexicana]KAI9497539.1 hypothetical protein BDB00DRAFT_756678 [Zychaea mexicana]
MKSVAFLAFALLSMQCVSAQVTAPTRNYNVTSPVTDGPYVVDQILPCTYRLFSDVDSSSLKLQIVLKAVSTDASAQQQDITIAENADVSKTEASAKHAGNMTYYEHSINFKIPQTVRPGKYNVVFKDKSTNTELEVPIEIRSAAAANSPSTGTGGKTSGSSLGDGASVDGSKSIFAASAVKTTPSSSFSVPFFCVSIAAATAAFALV